MCIHPHTFGGVHATVICSAVDTLASKGVNFAKREIGMSCHDRGVRGPLSVVAEKGPGIAGRDAVSAERCTPGGVRWKEQVCR